MYAIMCAIMYAIMCTAMCAIICTAMCTTMCTSLPGARGPRPFSLSYMHIYDFSAFIDGLLNTFVTVFAQLSDNLRRLRKGSLS